MTKRVADVDILKVQTGDMLESLANANGLTWQQLARFNWNTEDPKQINRCLREIVGCTKRTADGKNYKFDSSDDPGLLYIPKPLQLPGLSLNRPYVLRVSKPRLHGRVTIQTVDYFGHALPNVALHLNPIEAGEAMDLTTNPDGVWASTKVISGRYFVEERDGSATFYYEKLNIRDGKDADDPFGHLVPAEFTTQTLANTIISVVAGPLPSPQEQEERRLLTNTYYRSGRRVETPGRGEETAGNTRRSFETCADNLLLAAGWNSDYSEINWQNLVLNMLPGWLETYYPSVISQTFYLVVLDESARKFTVWNFGGGKVLDLEMDPSKNLNGLYGIYSLIQNQSGPYFVDLATRSSIIDIVDEAEDLGLESLLLDPAPYIDYYNSHSVRVEIVCLAPSADLLGSIALQGGTGRLEDYGHSGGVNAKIHARNVAVCRNMRIMYDAYILGYIKRVQEAEDEDALRALGPPLNFHEMPLPAGWTKDQVVDIFNAQFTNDELDAWIAIAQKMDDLNGRKSQGHPFFRFKVKYKKDAKKEKAWKSEGFDKQVTPEMQKLSFTVAAEVEVEAFMDIQVIDGDIRMIHKEDMSSKLAAKLRYEKAVEVFDPFTDDKSLTKRGYPLELSFKQSLGNPEKNTIAFRMDSYAFEVDNLGKTKISVETRPGVWLDAEYSVPAAEMGIGVTIKFKDVAAKMKEQAKAGAAVDQRLLRWAEKLESVEVQGLVGFVGLREETALAVFSSAPGFFQRRSLDDLWNPETQWNDLNADEVSNLVTLGWTQDLWNMKYEEENQSKLPDSIHKTRSELVPTELIAIVHLGFYAYEDYGKHFKKGLSKNADFVF